MIIGMHRRLYGFFSGDNFICTNGNNLIHVHIGGGAGSCLENIHHKLVFKFSCHDLLCGLGYSRRDFPLQQTELKIYLGRTFFYQAKRVNKLRL